MADRQRRAMGIRNIIGLQQPERPQHSVQKRRVAVCRPWDPSRGATEPVLSLPPCGGERHRPLQDSSVRHDAKGPILRNLANMRLDQHSDEDLF